jgi:hypothetical protein
MYERELLVVSERGKPTAVKVSDAETPRLRGGKRRTLKTVHLGHRELDDDEFDSIIANVRTRTPEPPFQFED